MNKVSRTITGITMISLGLALTIISFFKLIFLLIYGLPVLIIGLFILFNKNEDKIEEIKVKGGRK